MSRGEELLWGPRLPLAVALVLAFIGLVSWDPTPVGAMHDDGVYALLGRALADGHGYRFAGIAGEPWAPRFPPLYPGLLALLWMVADDVDFVSKAGTGLNLLFMTGAGALFAVYLRDRLGFGSVLAGGVTLLAWSYTHLWTAAFVPLSEPLFLVLMVGALLTLARLEGVGEVDPALHDIAAQGREMGDRWRQVALLIVLLALLTYTRSAGIALVGGSVLGLALRRRFVEAGVVGGTIAMILAPWILWSSRVTATLPDELRDYFSSYSGWLFDQLGTDPGGFVAELPRSFSQVTALLSDALLPGRPGSVLLWVGSPLLLLSAWGLLRLARRSPGAALSAALYLAMLVVWPFRNTRLIVPLVPFLMTGLAFAYLGIRDRVGQNERIVVSGVAAAYVVVLVALASVRLFGLEGTRPLRIRTVQLGNALAAVTSQTPSGAVVGAPELWPAIPLYTDRIGVPSARFRLGGDGPRQGTPEEQHRVWILTGMDYVITESAGRIHGTALDAIDEACPGQLAVRARWDGGQALVELGWDEDCRRRLGLSPSR